VWLEKLSKEMIHTLEQLLVECVQKGRAMQAVNPADYPSQILCLAEQILFPERCEQAVKKNSLTEFAIELESTLDGYTSTDIKVSCLL